MKDSPNPASDAYASAPLHEEPAQDSVPAAASAPEERARRTVSFDSIKSQNHVQDMLRWKKPVLKAIQAELGVSFEKIPGNYEPITEIAFYGTKEKETFARKFFNAMISHANKGGGINEKQVRLAMSRLNGRMPTPAPAETPAPASARAKFRKSAGRTVRETIDISRPDNHGHHNPDLQKALNRIFVKKKGHNKTIGDFIGQKMQVDLGVETLEGQPITHLKITAASDKLIEQAKTLVNTLLNDTKYLNDEGMTRRLREKRLVLDIEAVRGNKTIQSYSVTPPQKKPAPPAAAAPEKQSRKATGLSDPYSELNPRQQAHRDSIRDNTATISIGEAGTTKTYTSVYAMALLLKEGKIRELLLCRPIVEAGIQDLGYLPGGEAEKTAPYMVPFFQALHKVFGPAETERLIESKKIQIVTLGFMRGMNIENAGVILDEAQNSSWEEIKMVLTRLGPGGKAAINGDPSQSDLKPGQSGLTAWADSAEGVKGFGVVRYLDEDIRRSPFVHNVIMISKRQEAFARAARENKENRNPMERIAETLTRMEQRMMGIAVTAPQSQQGPKPPS